MSNIRFIDSIYTTNDVSAVNIFASHVHAPSATFEGVSAGAYIGTFYGNLVGTWNNEGSNGAISQETLAAWNETLTLVSANSGAWNSARDKTISWDYTTSRMQQYGNSWDAAVTVTNNLPSITASFIFPQVKTITTSNVKLEQSDFNSTILANNINGDTFIVLPSSGVQVNSLARVVLTSPGKVFFAPESDTLTPIFNKNNGNCIQTRYAEATIIRIDSGWLLLGDVVLNQPTGYYWYSETPNQDWFNIDNWYYDSAHLLPANGIPTAGLPVTILKNPPIVAIDANTKFFFKEPSSITNISTTTGALIISSDAPFTIASTLQATHTTPIVFAGSATLTTVADTYYWYRELGVANNNWDNVDCWYNDRALTIQGNTLPVSSSVAVLIENDNIVYAPELWRTGSSLPTININPLTFASPSLIDARGVLNTLNMSISSTTPYVFTSTISANNTFNVYWEGSVIAGNN